MSARGPCVAVVVVLRHRTRATRSICPPRDNEIILRAYTHAHAYIGEITAVGGGGAAAGGGGGAVYTRKRHRRCRRGALRSAARMYTHTV